jgi:hypothetical protein
MLHLVCSLEYNVVTGRNPRYLQPRDMIAFESDPEIGAN